MEVKLLYFNDCPNWEITDSHLTELAEELPEIVITRQLVDTPEEAERVSFRGSPSVLVDGKDIFAGPGTPVSFSCRIYQTPAGAAGTPTLEQLRNKLTSR